MMKKVYICAPIGGDVEENLQKVKQDYQFYGFAMKCGCLETR